MSRGPDESLLALRIDVDFSIGLRKVVPRFLDALARRGQRATFFVVAGSNAPRHSLRRLSRPGYLRRLLRLGPVGILRQLLPCMAERGAFLDGPVARNSLRRIVEEGHEVAVHGHDHAWWADHAWQADGTALGGEIDRGFAAVDTVLGRARRAWGSPAWRTTPVVLRRLQQREVPYFADCWGTRPFLTRDDDGYVLPTAHLPVTLPSLESLMLVRGLDAGRAVTTVSATRGPGVVDVLCVHDYFEGLLRPRLFDELLDALAAHERRARTLADCAARIHERGTLLESRSLTRGVVPGFVGEVSWQRD